MKAISAIIVIILILMIVVALAGLSYTFFSGIFTSTTTTAEETIERTTESLLINMKIESVSPGKVYVRNTGQTDLTEISIYVNDEPADFIMSPPVVEPGEIGTVSLYDFVKKDDTIKISSPGGTVVSKTAPDPCDNPSVVLCLEFDEGSGTIAYDHSQYGNDGTLYNGTEVCSGGYCPKWVSGKFGGALELDGIGNFVNVTDSSSLDSGDNGEATIEMWVKPKSYGGNLIQKYYYTAGVENDGFEVWLNVVPGRTVEAWFGEFVSGDAQVGSINTIALDEWTHVAFVLNATNLTIYINGKFDNSGNRWGVVNFDNIDNLDIGSNDGEYNFFNGTIDEVRIYNKAIY